MTAWFQPADGVDWIAETGFPIIDGAFNPLPGCIWDQTTVWDGSPPPTTWDASGATLWDAPAGGPTVWDDGATIWDPYFQLLPANATGDIYIGWDNTQAIGDWNLAIGDLQTGQDLEGACLVSLFSDRLATPDFVPTDGTSDRRGWWADPYNEQPLGSNLWQLDRGKKTRDTLGLARSYALDALQWLVTDGVAQQVDCNTMWLGSAGSTALGIALAIVRPNGSVTRFTFGWAWQGLATLLSPVRVPPVPLQQHRMRMIR